MQLKDKYKKIEDFVAKILENRMDKFTDYKRIELLKKIEEEGQEIFTNDDFFAEARLLRGDDPENIQTVLNAVLKSHFQGVEEYSTEFFQLYNSAVEYQRFVRELIRQIFEEVGHGYNDFETQLILGALTVMDYYDIYYREWMKAVHNTPAAQKIKELQKKDSQKLQELLKKDEFNNHYTIITLDEDGEFTANAYIDFFEDSLGKVISAMNTWVGDLRTITNLTDNQRRYIEYLSHYIQCLSEDSIDLLEDKWTQLDQKWVAIQHSLQIVHDIEYGYGDPLRVKIIPDFSLRFLDEQYSKQNQRLQEVRDVLVDYYKPRKSALSEIGIHALQNSFAGIYYVPVRTGMPIHFRFAGQSIPNRPKVRAKEGIKIYFDPVSYKMRLEEVEEYIKKLFRDKSLVDRLDPIKSIVNDIAAHEFGHAIYGLESIVGEDGLDSETKSLLEEPRAELTAVTTLQLLYEKSILSKNELKDAVFGFMATDLRRFANYKSEATRPYTISAMYNYRVYEKTSYLSIVDGELIVDESKVFEVLEILQKKFNEILDAEDAKDVDKLQNILDEMQNESPLVKWLVKTLN
jgi:hypothetical protein